jgi:hypothetical protein
MNRVSSEFVVLALSTVVRPTSVAAVLALLSTRRPQRLLAAYTAAGLAFSLAVGAMVVVLLQEVVEPGADSVRLPLLQVMGGLIALGYAAAVGTGLLPRSHHPERATGVAHRRLQRLSLRGAAATGVLTHLPGLIYLAALHTIATSASGPLDALVQVAVYNALWFSLAIVALVLSVRRPTAVREAIERLSTWTRRHGRTVIVVGAAAVGGYLVVKGLLGLGPGAG